jgi:hypothetical protein
MRLRAVLTHQHLPFLLGLSGILITLPSLGQGWIADDLIHRTILLKASFAEALTTLFVFAAPDRNPQWMDIGAMPWWTAPRLHIAFFRPLTALTHWIDYRLWPQSALLMHAQSVLWYGAICILVTITYRRLMGATWIAGLAAFLFTVNSVHLGAVHWLANRNILLALFFGLLALNSHHDWRQSGKHANAAWAAWWLTLSLLSAEAGVATGAYLLAYAIFIDRQGWRSRVGSLIPYAALVVIWQLTYQWLGYGVEGSGFYVEPAGSPFQYAANVLERAPILLLTQWLGVIPLPYNLLSWSMSRVVWLGTLILVALMTMLLVPLWRHNRMACFWSLGMALSIVPACSIRLLSGRLLLFASLGAMALMAQFVGGILERAGWLPIQRGWLLPAQALCFLLLAMHAVLPLGLNFVFADAPMELQATIDQVIDLGPLFMPSHQEVIVVNAPSPFHFIYMPSRRELNHQPAPARTRLLAPGYVPAQVTRLDEQTLLVRVEHGFYPRANVWQDPNRQALPLLHTSFMYEHLAAFFHADTPPAQPGKPVELTGMHAEATAFTSDGRPCEARIQFDRPLEDSSLLWLQWSWDKHRFEPFPLPPIGATVQVSGPY